MVGGIWVCEFDGLVGDDILRERAAQLHLPSEGDHETKCAPGDRGTEGEPEDCETGSVPKNCKAGGAPKDRGTGNILESCGAGGAPEGCGTGSVPESCGAGGAPEGRGPRNASACCGTGGAPKDRGPGGASADRGTEHMREKTRQHILAWMLLARAAGELWGLTPAQLEIRRDSGGKPCSAAHPELQFNLSHCNTACACIVGDTAVGIDIERKFRYKEGLVKRFCHPEEYERLAEMDEPLRETQVHFLWSLKESFVKQDGRGLGYGMERVSFAPLLPVRLEPGGVFRRAYGGDELFLGDCGSYTLAACADLGSAADVDLSGAVGVDRLAGMRRPEGYASAEQHSPAGDVPAGVRGSRDGVSGGLRGSRAGVLAGVRGSADSALAEGITWQRAEIHRLTEQELVCGIGAVLRRKGYRGLS